MSEILEIIVKLEKSYYYSDENSFGICLCSFAEETDDSSKIKASSYGDFTLKGNMPYLEYGRKYKTKVKPKLDPKYGLGYEIQSIYELTTSTIEEQHSYLKTLLTKKQFDEMITVYPNEDILELIKEDKFDYKKVRGLGDKNYIKLKQKILENLQYKEAIIELSEKFGLTHNMIKKLCEHYKSPTILVQKVNENPYILADEVNGIGFLRADQMAMSNGIEPTSFNRIRSCIYYLLNEKANDGHSFLYLEEILALSSKLLSLKKIYIEEAIEKVIEEDKYDIRALGNKIALYNNYRTEKSIANHIERLLRNDVRFFVSDIDRKIEDVELEQGFPFTEEQKNAIYQAIEKNCLIVNGKAGTGKTSVLLGIMKVLMSANNDLSYSTCALSGKASLRIQESTKLNSSTIHRLLKYSPRLGFYHNEENPLESDIVVLDEASMVNIYLMESLVSSIKSGAKFICLGDTSQLEPIGCGNAFFDLIQSGAIPRVELTQVHRQAQKSGILTVANKIREGKQFVVKDTYKSRKLGELEDLYFYPFSKQEKVLDKVLEISKQYKGSILDYQVIVPMKSRGNLCTKELNKHLQEIFNPKTSNTKFLKRGEIEYREMDKLIQNGNNYEKDVLNGSIGIIEFVDTIQNVLHVKFEGSDRLVLYSKDELKELDLAYSLTVHRTQGSQFKNVVFALDNSAYIMLSRQLSYTALTRAIDYCFLVCELDSIRKSIRIDKSTKRQTFLQELLNLGLAVD
jgi:exodeoxyribonuclease V alpha subunit